jgi:hypothetical protein
MKPGDLLPRHKRELQRILAYTARYFKRKQFYPRSKVYLDKVVLGHVSKAVTVARGVLCLVDAGLPEEAFGLSRTLVEVAFNLRFIANKNSENRATRFVHYFAVWKLEQIRRGVKHFKTEDKQGRPVPKYKRLQLLRQMPESKELAKLARKFPNRNSWTQASKRRRGSAWKMAIEPDKHEMVAGQPVDWEFDYDWVYFWTSQYVHATVACMDSHSVIPAEAFSVHIAPQRGEHTAGLAVFNVGLYLSKVLVLAFRAIKHDPPDELLKPLGNLLGDLTRRS